MNITLANIDLTRRANVEHVVAALHVYASLPAEHLACMRDITIDFAGEAGGVSPAPVAPADPLALYGGNTRRFLEVMLARIEKFGSTTLEDAAKDASITLDTARAYLRNAGRTASAHKVTLPVKPQWQHDMGCNTYIASDV